MERFTRIGLRQARLHCKSVNTIIVEREYDYEGTERDRRFRKWLCEVIINNRNSLLRCSRSIVDGLRDDVAVFGALLQCPNLNELDVSLNSRALDQITSDRFPHVKSLALRDDDSDDFSDEKFLDTCMCPAY